MIVILPLRGWEDLRRCMIVPECVCCGREGWGDGGSGLGWRVVDWGGRRNISNAFTLWGQEDVKVQGGEHVCMPLHVYACCVYIIVCASVC